MRYSVQFTEDVPAELHPSVFEVLVDIAEVLRTIPSSSAFWAATDDRLAELNVGGWTFDYRIEHREHRIVVVGARPMGAAQRVG